MNVSSKEADYRLAYEAATRAIEHQARAVDGLRSRAGMLLVVMSLSTSFLAGLASPYEHWVSWAAIGVFIVDAALTTVILLPSRGWVFVFSARKIIRDYIEGENPSTLAETYRDLALHLDDHHDRNQKHLNRLYAASGVAVGLFVAAIVLWLVVLHLGGG